MAIYSYLCKKCGKVIDIEKSMDCSGQIEYCNKCGGLLTQTFHTVNFNLNKWDTAMSFNDVSKECDGDRDAQCAGFFD